MKNKWLKILSYGGVSRALRMLVNGRIYEWIFVSAQFFNEIDDDLDKDYNQGRILKRIERDYGKGRKNE